MAMGGLVDVLDVSILEDGAAQLAGCRVDLPTPGGEASKSSTYALDIRGWVVGRDSPAVAVELVHDDACLWHVPLHPRADVAKASHLDAPELCGYYTTTNTLRLGSEFTVVVRAVLEDEKRIEFALVKGRRSPLRSSFQPRLRPLMVTTMGRTGSTILMRLLESHPAIVAYPPFEDEPKVASYWIDVLLALSEPASYRRQLVPGRNLTDTWWLGTQMPMPREATHRATQEWIGVTSIETIAEFCQQRIEALYMEIASELGVRDPIYFAEKYWGGSVSTVPAFMWELYPDAREVIVVRDFRDMVSSMYAFDAKRGFRAFGRQAVADDRSHIENLRPRVDRLLRGWQRRGDRAHLVRYEDLIARPAETLEGMLDYLGIESTPETIESMTRALTDPTPQMEAHRTTPDADASVGRWRRDLDAELQRACESAFGPALEAFGYL
jgi:hypothetical protein